MKNIHQALQQNVLNSKKIKAFNLPKKRMKCRSTLISSHPDIGEEADIESQYGEPISIKI